MKMTPTAHERISNMGSFFRTNNSKLSYLDEEPLRAELFTSGQMELYGKALASTHKLSSKPTEDHLLKRLADNEILLNEVRKLLTDTIKKKYQITPAGEWLLDNFYLIQEHIRNAKKHLPKNYSEGLPQLAEVSSLGLTRIYDIALKIISHSDGRVDIESLGGFIKAYQSVTHLKLGELWAIPIMLRLALLENLRRVASRLAIDRIDSNLANYWANQMLETTEKDPKNLILVISDMARSNPPIVSAFVSELTRQLRGKGPDVAMALNWTEQQLSAIGLTSIELVNAENQKQAANQVSMSNCIGSLRLLGTMDWRDFVEENSIVEQTLRLDHNGVYGLMDFATRDHYRHVVEHIAQFSNATEHEVAKIAINLMQEELGKIDNDDRRKHVGYYLVDEGHKETKWLARMKISSIQKIRNAMMKHAFPVYLSIITLITLFISTLILVWAYWDTDSTGLLLLIGFLSVLCASQLALSVVNFISTLLVKPYFLPRMDFSELIPYSARTLVITPVMLTNIKEIEDLTEMLEVRFLANRNQNLHFGLLTDFTDAPEEKLPKDQALLDLAEQKVHELNKKYRGERQDLFYLFHRPRHWNETENVWMGYERKRGKLSELNALLRGHSQERFSLVIGDQSIFPQINYIITLDADTQLPMGTAWKMIGTLAHPLNRAFYDEEKKRVTKGYGILQPRIAISLPDIRDSLYARMHGNEPGIDPYTRASSDVYQDLFAEGSFIGKGIYDLDIFNSVLEGRFAENRILSHDLIEGCYVRSGLLSDIQLFEKYPTTYGADIKRRERWIRGDWQIFSWMLPYVPGVDGKWIKNPISGLSKWKIADNIRRSLVPIALTLLLLIGWVLLASPIFWTFIVSAIIVIPILITSGWDTLKKPKDIILPQHIKNSLRNIGEVFIRTIFTLISLPFEAFANFNSIILALYRMIFSRKKMLEWSVSSNDSRNGVPKLSAYYLSMWIQPFFAFTVLTGFILFSPTRIALALPILILWLIAPYITWWLSLPLKKQVSILTDEQTIFLRKLARKTWSFFEYYVGEEDNWLPPDNMQEQPEAMIAHRTSPTNIGLSLLSNLSACDFGYISTGQFLDRTKATLATMGKMEMYRGHFYNWYDTESLAPLFPKYISTVDSGNLAGHLLVLRQGLLAIPYEKIHYLKSFEGLKDSLHILTDTLKENDKAILQNFRIELNTVCQNNLIAAHELKFHIGILSDSFDLVIDRLSDDPISDTYRWVQLLARQLKCLKEDFKIFTPWAMLMDMPFKFIDFSSFSTHLSLIELLQTAKSIEVEVINWKLENATYLENNWLHQFESALSQSIHLAQERIIDAENLAEQCNSLSNMEWEFLYDKKSKLMAIGYNVQDHHRDTSYYDLLASEARLCNFIGIAQGKLPEESWFALGRLLTNVNGSPILLSWSGSMFEYLMPFLVMPSYDNTLLAQTCKAAVDWQIEYGKQTGHPWGISESGYNMINSSTNYMYRAFGAPGLGLKRGLEEDYVIAPYATMLALMVSPVKACKNLELLSEKGFAGDYGLYEAIDYTPARLPRGQTSAVVYSFMAHHQGMGLLSIAYLLLDKPMQKRFEAEPQFKSALLLLQERIPKATTYFAHTTDIADINYEPAGIETRIINKPNTPVPEVQLLSNGKYHVMITNAGTGYSRWKDLAVTRWREDSASDNWGTFCYIRDCDSDTYWSNTYQPTLKKTEKYEAVFSQSHVDFRTANNGIETHTEIVVSPEDDIEMRRLRISNNSNLRRTIELTSFAEVVLAPNASDYMQQAFSSLFVQTEIIPHQFAIRCTRRPRSIEEQTPWMFHQMTLLGKEALEISYETDRMKFIGRGNTGVNPQAMKQAGKLSGSQGSVLDPVVAIRYKIILEPEESITLDMITGIGSSSEICQHLIDKYQDKHHKDRIFELAWTHSQVLLRQINATERDAQLYAQLANSILFPSATFRADPSILVNNRRGQSGLWGYSISGDLPIVLLKIENQENMQLARQLIQAHAYWRLKGLAVDLVIWNEEKVSYRQDFQNEIISLIPPESKDRTAGIFLRVADQISTEDRILFQTVARVILSDIGGTLADHVKRKPLPKLVIPYISPVLSVAPVETSIPLPKDLLFFNGLGGFSPDCKEYVIILDEQNITPVPWVNVIANPHFGTVVSESGGGYTWTENAHELRLTPWNNDPVSDKSGEVFYIRDEESGHFWTTTLLPAGGKSPYITRHGFGYTSFEHSEDGIHTEMTVHVDNEAAVKFTVLKITNHSGRPRKISVTGYTEWVLDNNRMKTGMHINTEIDPDSGAILAKNPFNIEFANRVAFFDVDFQNRSFTADRTEFIGRNGTLKKPIALFKTNLSGKVGLALDPCAAIQISLELGNEEEQEVIFRLGAGKNTNEARSIVKQFRGSEAAQSSLDRVKNYWKHTIGSLQIETPDSALNIMSNGWLTYQTLSSRLWGRSGFYQSGGAFGYRDQLQDVMSLLQTAPHLARQQILLCASRQFMEGDVQHWWHPPKGNGVRTLCSDDYLWLPYVTANYVRHTGDEAILDEEVHFIEGRKLNEDEESYYATPTKSGISASLYVHCVNAIKHGFNFGKHGLPLIGTGDWNDGFDKVGHEGKGESVWMAFFLYEILNKFAKIASLHEDEAFAEECISQAQTLKENIDQHAWDGDWYKRAWFDNGRQLGSAMNKECRIDSIAQSWSVLSGAGKSERVKIAMESAYQNLVDKQAGIIKLLDPAFDTSDMNPGYIKGYVPGVRENGGQYTHAAVWMIMAFARLGETKKVWELLKMIIPINHAKSPDEVAIYKVEPYVLAADVYSNEAHAGRGGWTWYTGSAAWMYRLIIESFLGIHRKGNELKIAPCIPEEWTSFKVHYRFMDTMYHITVSKSQTLLAMPILIDGIEQKDEIIRLVNDGIEHQVELRYLSITGPENRIA